MFKKYTKNIFLKAYKYNKKATNPFLSNIYEPNSKKTLHEQIYIWVEKTNNPNI